VTNTNIMTGIMKFFQKQKSPDKQEGYPEKRASKIDFQLPKYLKTDLFYKEQ
jgi:hypothetical protein